MAQPNASYSGPAGCSWQKSLCLQYESLSQEDWRQLTLIAWPGYYAWIIPVLYMHHPWNHNKEHKKHCSTHMTANFKCKYDSSYNDPPFLVAVVLQMSSWMCLNCKAGKLSGYQNEKINLRLCTVSLTILINLQFFCGPPGCFLSQFVRGGLTEATTFPEGFFFVKSHATPEECPSNVCIALMP